MGNEENRKTIKLVGIKCKDKYYISRHKDGCEWGRFNNTGNLLINGYLAMPTFHRDWNIVDKEPTTVQVAKRQRPINQRYELIDPSLASNKIPLVFPQEDVIECFEDVCHWKDEFRGLESLYRLCGDKQPDILEDIDFEYETIVEVSEIKDFGEFKYKIHGAPISKSDISYHIMDRITFPDILLSMRPCCLTSRQSFDIVAEYIKQNIDNNIALVNAHFDSYFRVSKKIALSVPESHTYYTNMFGKGKRKTVTEWRKHREIECFNMAPKPYEKYWVIPGFRGKNQEDLKNNIDKFCMELMAEINEPVIDCPHCKGMGVIFKPVSIINPTEDREEKKD